MKEVMYLTGLSRPSVYRLMKDGLFPNSIDLGERSVAWVDEEVQDWVEQKINSARSN
jgi:prophage regulatory protein